MKKMFIIRLIASLVFIQVYGIQANAKHECITISHPLMNETDSIPPALDISKNAWTVFGEDGSVQFSDETIRLISDSIYRQAKYPEVYNALQVPELLDSGDIAFALWTIINVYKIQPEHVRVIAFKLADHGIQGMHYLNAFYTYAFADPEVMDFADTGAPTLGHPQVLEEKLLNCRTLAAYTDKVIDMREGDK